MVLAVLRASGVIVSENGDGSVVMKKDAIVETQYLSDAVHRRMLGHLPAKFGVDIHLFWHPEELALDLGPAESWMH